MMRGPTKMAQSMNMTGRPRAHSGVARALILAALAVGLGVGPAVAQNAPTAPIKAPPPPPSGEKPQAAPAPGTPQPLPTVSEEAKAGPQRDPNAITGENVVAELLPDDDAPRETRRTEFKDIGLTEYIHRKFQGRSIALEYKSRADRVVTDATLQLLFESPKADPTRIRGLDVLFNNTPVKRLDKNELDSLLRGYLELPIDPRLLGARNTITLNVLTDGKPPYTDCVAPGTWSLVAFASALETVETKVPVQNDLAVLPMPFFDPNIEKRVSVPFVFPSAPSIERQRAGFLVANYWGMQDIEEAEFPVYFGTIPSESAVLIATSAELSALGLQGVSGPTLRFIDNPMGAGADAKLLIVAGTNEAEINVVAEELALGRISSFSNEVKIQDRQPIRVVERYDTGNFLTPGKMVQFDELASGGALTIDGRNDGIITLKFKLQPEIFFWPQTGIPVTLHYEQAVEPENLNSTIVAMINGNFVKILQRGVSRGGTGGVRQMRFALPQRYLGSTNELQFFSEFDPPREGCPLPFPKEKTVIAGDSTMDLRNATEFAVLPDISQFAKSGFPYTRYADLSETVIVLPNKASQANVSALLGIAGHFARVAQYPSVRAEFARADSVGAKVDKDILVLGTVEDQPLIGQWGNRAPARLTEDGVNVPPPAGTRLLLNRFSLSARDLEGDAREAQIYAQDDDEGIGVVTSFESPLVPHRTVLIVSSTRDNALPNLSHISTFPEIRNAESSDLVLTKGDDAQPFSLGPDYGVGELDRVREVLWFFSKNSLLLVPLLVISALIIGLLFKLYLDLKEKERLA
jgi:hypothetical protein